jgi:hypothetical protein
LQWESLLENLWKNLWKNYLWICLGAAILSIAFFQFMKEPEPEDFKILYYFGKKSILDALKVDEPTLKSLPDDFIGAEGFKWKLRDFGQPLTARKELKTLKSKVKEIGSFVNPERMDICEQFEVFAKESGLPYDLYETISDQKCPDE